MKVLGVDPGGQSTGMVVRDRDRLVGWHLCSRGHQPIADYIDQLLGMAVDLAHDTADAGGLDLIAIEGLNDPSPHMGMTSVRGLIDTATVIGALLAWSGIDGDPLGLLVDPGGHGSAAEGLGRAGLLACYPHQLVGDREDKGAGRLRHVRSAWDVAAAGARQHCQEAARA